MVARQVIIKGKVQGVWFRAWTKEQSDLLGLTGWVKNIAGGGVEAFLLGEQAKVERLIELFHEGPPMAKVESVQAMDVTTSEDLEGFEVRY